MDNLAISKFFKTYIIYTGGYYKASKVGAHKVTHPVIRLARITPSPQIGKKRAKSAYKKTLITKKVLVSTKFAF